MKIMSKRSTQRPQPSSPRTPAYRPPPPHSQYGTKSFDPIDPRWLLNALGTMIVFAIFCAWLLVCFVFTRTQWQYVLHPSRTISSAPAGNFDEVRFGPDSSGQPQLDGWWIPGDSASAPTVLILHSGDGSMSDALPQATTLHDANLNVLLFDYRGYGRSLGQHPTQQLMQTDAASALTYLTGSRHIPAANILIYGIGAGASLAIQLCAEHKELPALILDAPAGDFRQHMIDNKQAKAVPVQILFTQDFPLTTPLSKLQTPKLLVTPTDATPAALPISRRSQDHPPPSHRQPNTLPRRPHPLPRQLHPHTLTNADQVAATTTPYCLFPIPYSLLPTPYSLLPVFKGVTPPMFWGPYEREGRVMRIGEAGCRRNCWSGYCFACRLRFTHLL